jgi:transposase-like protein
MPCVINVDKNPAYAFAVTELTANGTISRRCRLRQCKHLNDIVEQAHRNTKRRMWLAKGYGSYNYVANPTQNRGDGDSEKM